MIHFGTPIRRCALAAVLWLALFPSNALAKGEFFVGEWRGAPIFKQESGAFKGCMLWRRISSDEVLTFALFPSGNLSVVVHNARWRLDKEEEYPVSLNIDGRAVGGKVAKAISKDRIQVYLGNTGDVFRRLQAGRVLRIAAARDVFRYRLTGTKAALPHLLECVRKRAFASKDKANPFADGAKSTRKQDAISKRRTVSRVPGAKIEGQQVRALSEFSLRAAPVYKNLIAAFEKSIELDELAAAYSEGQISRSFVDEKRRTLIDESRINLAMASQTLVTLEVPRLNHPIFRERAEQTLKYLYRFKGQIEGSIADGDALVEKALSGNNDDIVASGFARMRGISTILESENIYLGLQKATISEDHPQAYLYSAIIASNNILRAIYRVILAYAMETKDDVSRHLQDGLNFSNKAVGAIDDGRRAVLALQRRLATEKVGSATQRDTLRNFIQGYADSFDVEEGVRQILAETLSKFSEGEMDGVDESLLLLDPLVDKRMQLQNDRMRHLSNLGQTLR